MRIRMLRIRLSAIFLGTAVCVASLVPAAAFGGETAAGSRSWLESFVATENVWIARLQLTNGALAKAAFPAVGEVSVNPYFSDIAMRALLRNAAAYYGNVRWYLDWHFAHLNTAAQDVSGVAGTIYDYTIVMEGGAMSSEKPTQVGGKSHYDSTDSYAATFLTLLREYACRVSGTTDYVVAHADQIDLIVSAMLATQQSSGLTEATPAYAVQYLMDNCEVFQGLDDAVALYRDIIVPKTGTYHTNAYQKAVTAFVAVSNAIEKSLWNAAAGDHYKTALFRDGTEAYVFAWTNFYPSATAQLFPITCGVTPVSSTRARALYTAFCGAFKWQAMKIPETFYWGHNAYAAALMGDTDRVLAYLACYQQQAAKTGHAYPLYNADAGWAVLAADALLARLESADASTVWCATVDGLATNGTDTVTLLDASFKSPLVADAFGAASFWLTPGDYVCGITSTADGSLRCIAVSTNGTAAVTETTLAVTALSATNGVPVIAACSPASLMAAGRVETVYATNLSSAVWTNDASIARPAATVFMKLRVK